MADSQDYFQRRTGAENVLTNLRLSRLSIQRDPKDSQLVSKVNILSYLLNLQKLFEMRISVFSIQLRTTWYRSTYILAGSGRNIPVNTRE
jgi:hypothetical protein